MLIYIILRAMVDVLCEDILQKFVKNAITLKFMILLEQLPIQNARTNYFILF